MDGPLPPNLVQAWEAFFAASPPRSVWADGTLFPLQRRRENEKMCDLAKVRDPRTLLCIGADKGADVYLWLTQVPTLERAIVIEPRGVPYAAEFHRHFPLVDFFFHERSSFDPETVKRTAAWLDKDRIDVAWLDGHKGHYGDDFNAYFPLVREGGLFMLHDVHPPTMAPPGAVFEALKQAYETYLIVDVSEGLEAQQREKDGVPAASEHEAWNRIWGATSCGVGVVVRP